MLSQRLGVIELDVDWLVRKEDAVLLGGVARTHFTGVGLASIHETRRRG